MQFKLFGRSFNVGRTKGASLPQRTISPTSFADMRLLDLLNVGNTVITPEVTAGIPAAHYCVDKISSFLASMPTHIYRHTDRGRERVLDHDQSYLVSKCPNPYETKVEYEKLVYYTLLLWGNSIEWIERNQMGRPVAYWRWHPRDVTITMIDGVKYYKNHQTGQTVDHGDIIHMTDGPIEHYDGGAGGFKYGFARSRISRAYDTFKEAKQYQNFSRAFIENGTHLGLHVSYAGKLLKEDIDRVENHLSQNFSGVQNSNKNLVTGGGASVVKLGMPLKDAQLIETRQIHANDIGLLFGFKPGQLGGQNGESYNSLEQYNIEFVQYPCMPLAQMREQCRDRRIFRTNEMAQLCTVVDFSLQKRGSIKDRVEMYKILMQYGALEINDLLKLENMNTFDGGDVRIAPLNMTTLDNLKDGNNLSNKSPNSDEEE